MAEAIFCDWVWVVAYVDIVAVVSSIVVVTAFSGSFVVEVNRLFFNVRSIGVYQICWSTMGSSVSLSWLSSSLSVLL